MLTATRRVKYPIPSLMIIVELWGDLTMCSFKILNQGDLSIIISLVLGSYNYESPFVMFQTVYKLMEMRKCNQLLSSTFQF